LFLVGWCAVNTAAAQLSVLLAAQWYGAALVLTRNQICLTHYQLMAADD